MSNVFDAIAWAIKVSKGEPMQARMLLIVGLAQRVNGEREDFLVWPSVQQICDDTDMGRTSVKKWLRYLEEHGFVERMERKRENGTSASNYYRLPIKAVFFHPTKGAMEDEDSRGRIPTGRGRDTTGDGSVDATGRGRPARPPIEQQEEHQLEDRESTPAGEELDLGLPPLHASEPKLADLSREIGDWWRAREDVTPLRGRLPTEVQSEKALKLALGARVDGQTVLDVWREIFEHIAASDFLQGKVPGREGRPPFKLTLGFLLEKRNFDKTLEGRFDGKSSGEHRRGSTSEATGRVLDRVRSAHNGRTGRGDSRGALPGPPSRFINRG